VVPTPSRKATQVTAPAAEGPSSTAANRSALTAANTTSAGTMSSGSVLSVASAAPATTTRQALTPSMALAPGGPLGIITGALTNFVSAILSPFIAALPTSPSTESPFAWALLAFARRNFFNESPKITDVYIASQQNNTGIITGDIDAIDPDELGKTVQVRASVQAGAPTPTGPGTPSPDPNLILVGAFTNPAVLGTAPGDTWHAPAAVDNTTVYFNATTGGIVYEGTETGQVTIDGLGTGDVVLEFTGNLFDEGRQEQSFATLVPELGTGELKGVTGTVHSVSTLNADGTATGVLTGQVVRPEVRYVVVRKPAHGTVTVDETTGAFTYTPDPELLQNGGPDSFQVMVTDNRFNLFQVFQPFNGDPVRTVNLSVASATV
jgi:hypothetical protein